MANPFSTNHRPPGQQRRQKKDTEKEQKSGWPGASRLGVTISRGQVLTNRLVKTEDAAESFLRHADLSPDGRPLRHSTKGNRALRIPLTTHRWDESDRVFLAGCSPAEPASASSIDSAYQSFHVRSVSDPPAGPCVFVACAREFRLPIHPTVCFKVGRFTLTQSSWTASWRCSRKWMSGHAATALVLIKGSKTVPNSAYCPLGEPFSPSQGEPPFPVDFYLSWMVTNFRGNCSPRGDELS